MYSNHSKLNLTIKWFFLLTRNQVIKILTFPWIFHIWKKREYNYDIWYVFLIILFIAKKKNWTGNSFHKVSFKTFFCSRQDQMFPTWTFNNMEKLTPPLPNIQTLFTFQTYFPRKVWKRPLLLYKYFYLASLRFISIYDIYPTMQTNNSLFQLLPRNNKNNHEMYVTLFMTLSKFCQIAKNTLRSRTWPEISTFHEIC